jgi:hypothetical protein
MHASQNPGQGRQGPDPSTALPAELHGLFWDCEPSALDLNEHREHIIERILNDGAMDSVRWLLRAYGDDSVRGFVVDHGAARLDPKVLSFWYGYYELGDPPCTERSSLIGNKRAWRY